MNRLLKRQLKKHFGISYSDDKLLNIKIIKALIDDINQSYDFKDKEIRLLGRTIDTNSEELNDANEKLKIQNNEISKLATLDSLTGLLNRHSYDNILERTLKIAKRNNKQFSILFIDLDHFKNINDTLGHHIGDLLLKEVAKKLQSCIRESDIVSRIGGDEFNILLEGITAQNDAAYIAKRILAKMSKSFNIESHKLTVTASIGISNYPSNGVTLSELLKNADIAMYQAKELGRNRYQFYNLSTD
ncbi:GGDEF domain-containing protein [Desulfobacterales bacterium HSG17]|nr:GGDEF domain-containing protein [Desulfobacterales bacterium HSG17]